MVWRLLFKDRTVLNDLAAVHPDKVREMAAPWEAYAKRADVLRLGAWLGLPAGRIQQPATR